MAAEAVSRAAPDGLTLFFASNALVLNAAIDPSLPYALPDSFATVGTFCTAPNLFWCAADRPWRDLTAVTAEARASPGSLALRHHRRRWHRALRWGDAVPGAWDLPYPCPLPWDSTVNAGRDRRPRAAACPWNGRCSGTLPGGANTTTRGAWFETCSRVAGGTDNGRAGPPCTGFKVCGLELMAPAGTPPALIARMAHDLEVLTGSADIRVKLATQAAVPDFTGPDELRHTSD